jgi:hypothetical protein
MSEGIIGRKVKEGFEKVFLTMNNRWKIQLG